MEYVIDVVVNLVFRIAHEERSCADGEQHLDQIGYYLILLFESLSLFDV